MPWKLRLHLIWKILTGKFETTEKYYNPKYGTTEVNLRDKRLTWGEQKVDYEKVDEHDFCEIDPRCVGRKNHHDVCHII